MIRKISVKICGILNEYSPRNEEENSVVCYGIEILLSFFSKVSVLVSLGILFNRQAEAVIFLLAFSSLRSQAGGIHAETDRGCLAAMLITWGIGIFLREYIQLSQKLVVYVGTFCFLTLLWLAPQFTGKGIQLPNKAVMWKKIKSVLLTISLLAVAFISCKMRGILVTAVFIETLTVVMERTKKWKISLKEVQQEKYRIG